MAASSPLPYTARDIAQLKQALLRGDDAAKRAALVEAVGLGLDARPLLQVIADQWLQGLLVPSSMVVDLLQAIPDPYLHKVAIDAGLLAQVAFYDKCRLFALGFGSFEGELCTYVYRHWSDMADPMVSEAVGALKRKGTSEARDALAAVLPELAELANTAASSNPDPPIGSSSQQEMLQETLRRIDAGVAAARLELIRSAISAIETREGSGA